MSVDLPPRPGPPVDPAWDEMDSRTVAMSPAPGTSRSGSTEHADLRSRLGTRRGGVLSRLEHAPTGQSRRSSMRQELFERLLRDLETGGAGALRQPKRARARIRRVVREAQERRQIPQLHPAEAGQLEGDLISELLGFGPLDRLLADPAVSDVLVNGPEEVWVDRYGKLESTNVRFDSAEHLMRLVVRIVASTGRHLDEASPMVDVRLEDGSRLHAVIPPLVAEPTVSIRRMRQVRWSLADLVAVGSMSEDMARFLADAVRWRRNIVISGGAATGKTTLLNVLSTSIPSHERIITIEETAELDFDHPHVVTLEGRTANIEGRGEVSLRELLRGSLRMRADRIVVGEVRGAEVFDMLQAMNTGHAGSLTTVHANGPQDALRRLENLVLMGGFELPSSAIRELLGAAFDLVVQTTRYPDGSRRVSSIHEVQSAEGILSTNELFRFRRAHDVTGSGRSSGQHVANGDPWRIFESEDGAG